MDFLSRHLDVVRKSLQCVNQQDDAGFCANDENTMARIIMHLSALSWPERRESFLLWDTVTFCGALLLVAAAFSMIPGRTHAIAAKILRWPALFLMAFSILVEFSIYLAIRLFIRFAEILIARPKHRRLRRRMAQAKSYLEWFALASELDQSQQRHRWLQQDTLGGQDEEFFALTSTKRYDWRFIRELIDDMKRARTKGSEDPLQALAVLQHCMKKNLCGVMSEDLFSYSNAGEPKQIVREFVEEVAASLQFLTNDAKKIGLDGTNVSEEALEMPGMKREQSAYEKILHKKVRMQNTKLMRESLALAAKRKGQKMPAELLELLSEEKDSEENEYEVLLHEKLRTQSTKLQRQTVMSTVNLFGGGDGKDSQRSTMVGRVRLGNEKSHGSSSIFHRMEVLSFLKRARVVCGRSALCLSGGAMMAIYHVGHIKGLLEAGVLPDVISGSSGGSGFGAMVCTRTDEELQRDLEPEVLAKQLKFFDRPWGERLKSLVSTGGMFSPEHWRSLTRWCACGDTTFAEAYQKTGRILNICLSSTVKKAPPVLLNYLTAPDVTIASATAASGAVPGLLPPVRLQYKDSKGVVRFQGGEKYIDGSIVTDIPVNALAEMFNCQFFITCQVNPHVVPFFFNSKGGVGRPSRWSSGTQEDSYRGGFLLSALATYLMKSMKAKFQFIHDLEVGVGLSILAVQSFEGSTTIVPQTSLRDYLQAMSDPTPDYVSHCTQGGSIAAYEHTAMIKLYCCIADTLDECIEKLEEGESFEGMGLS